MKILSPVGNFECLKAAVFGGADEVYLGINDFNARNNVDGFSISNLDKAVEFAHLYGVKVLLAINILFTDEELQSALDVIIDAYNLGVDAFILQDLGLISIVSSKYPQIELHASTQMGLHNLEGVEQVLKYGIKRVVLSRETPLSEVKRIKQNTNIEIEYFTHGALCVSFSGNCYMSSYLHDASGNRGRCKQLCRLPYQLKSQGKIIRNGYLLSAKDFDMTKRLNELADAGVDVLKIEGRARRPFYVYTATSVYSKLLKGEKVDFEQLKLAFNRNFTQGYLNGNSNIISNIQSHIGIKIGSVEKVNYGKKFNEVFFSSNQKLSEKSTFKFFINGQEKNTLSAYDLTPVSDKIYKITTTQKIEKFSDVHLIVDAEKEKQVQDLMVKVPLKISVEFCQNKMAKAKINAFGKQVEIIGDLCQPALKQPLDKGQIIDNFKKSNFFDVELIFDVFESVFMPKQQLNELRRKTLEKAYEIYAKKDIEKLEKIKVNANYKINRFLDFSIVEKTSDLPQAKNVIFSPKTYDFNQIKELKIDCDKQGKNLYLDTPPFATQSDIELLREIIEKTGVGVVANNYYALSLTDKVVVGWGLNVYNRLTATEHNKPVVCAESSLAESIKAPYMTLVHCPIKEHIGGSCADCKFVDGLEYKMESGKTFKLKRKKLKTCTFYLTE